ncbi:peptidase domain-containing ABC transporter [Synechococcus sp. UW179A]|uniref:peptidase domain-containing ABC transporter n=1 Tax=Synechococcus sp. UW179A TaxID=2575510 RepID=UPI000E0E1222|nr:ATP-binding cassette domain-containing protein [Synechococcus sp. UW179A]
MTDNKGSRKESLQISINRSADSLDLFNSNTSPNDCANPTQSRLIRRIRKILSVDHTQPILGANNLEKLLEINSIFYRLAEVNSNKEFSQLPHLRFDLNLKTVYFVYFKQGRRKIYDPQNDVFIDPSNLRSIASPLVYELYPLLPCQCRSRWQLLGFIWPAIKNQFYPALILSFLLALLAITYPYITSNILGDVVPSGNISLIVNAFVLGMLIATLTAFFTWWKQYLVGKANFSLTLRLKVAIYDWFFKIPLRKLSDFTNGDLALRISELETVAEFLSSALIQGTADIFLLIGFGAMMIYYDYNLSFWLIAYTFLCALPTIVFSYKLSYYDHKVQGLSGDLSNFSLEALGSIVQIRSSGAESFVLHKWVTVLKQLSTDQYKSQSVADFFSALTTALSSGGQIFIYIIILWRLWHADSLEDVLLTTTVFIVFVGSYGEFNRSFNNLLYIALSQVTAIEVRWKRVLPLFEASFAEHEKLSELEFIDKKRVTGDISFRQLSFSYPGQTIPLFDSLNFNVHPGKVNAIFGPSGSGKSTIFKLILRLEQPTKGSIVMDTKPIEDFYVKDYRRLFGVIPQKSSLSAGSIRDAILAGQDYSDDQIWEALELVNIQDEIFNMPMKLYTVLSEGGMNVSGGQRQRIAIARAILQRPLFLLEDEATSALDNQSQAIISNNLSKLGITRLVIAHRLSAIAQADHLIVINDGKVEAEGSYASVIERSEFLNSVVN